MSGESRSLGSHNAGPAPEPVDAHGDQDLLRLSKTVRRVSEENPGDGRALAVQAIRGLGTDESSRRRQRIAHALLHLAVDLGILGGFLTKARGYLNARSRPWYGAGIENASDDPHVLRALGRHIASFHALEALNAEAGAAAASALGGKANQDDLPEELLIARAYAARLGQSFISDGIELLGASATSARHGFDAYWRDFTAHAHEEPLAASFADIGANVIRRNAGQRQGPGRGADTSSPRAANSQ